MMQELLKKLEDIELKVKALAEDHSQLRSENIQLKNENSKVKDDLIQLREQNKELEIQLSNALARVSEESRTDLETTRLKKELGQYIKAIDKCILMMREI